MATPEDPKATTVLFIGIVGAVSVFLIVVLLQIVFYRMQELETVRKDVALGPEELEQLDAGQLATLNSYGWVNEGDGVARIPIERAMALTVAELETERRATPPPRSLAREFEGLTTEVMTVSGVTEDGRRVVGTALRPGPEFDPSLLADAPAPAGAGEDADEEGG